MLLAVKYKPMLITSHSSGENACVAALEAAASGQAQEPKSTLDTVTEDPEKALEDVGKTLEGVGEGLKNLFGN